MPSKTLSKFAILLGAVLIASTCSPVFAKRSDKPPRTVAHSIVAKDYQRERLPSGEWKEDTYTFGFGKMMDPTERDESLTALSKEQMTLILAEALLDENYAPARERDNIDLLIAINWGKTVPFNDELKGIGLDQGARVMSNLLTIKDADEMNSGKTLSPAEKALNGQSSSGAESELMQIMMINDMAERSRREANATNARLLGYAPLLFDYYNGPPLLGARLTMMNELENEIESERYFVILVAYDFKKLIKEKQKKVCWITRFSIRAQGRKFDEELANMANAASSLFGVESKNLKRNMLPGKIRMGEIEVVDVLENDEAGEAKEEN